MAKVADLGRPVHFFRYLAESLSKAARWVEWRSCIVKENLIEGKR